MVAEAIPGLNSVGGWRHSPLWGYVVAVVATILVTLLRWMLVPLFGDTAPYQMFVISVVISAILGGIAPGLLATMLGALIGTWLFVEPRGRLELQHLNSDDTALLILFLSVGLVISLIGGRRRRAEERLRESELRFRVMVTASSDMVYRMGPDWTEMRDLDGRSFVRDSHTPSRAWLTDYIHPDDQPRVKAAIDEAIRSKSIFEQELRVVRQDGSLGWALSRAIPLLDDKGEIVEWFGAASDITRRKEAEEALQHALVDSQHFRKAVENVPVYVYMKDLEGRYLYANKPTLELFGCSAEEVVGHDDTHFFSPKAAKWLREVDSRVFKGEQTREEFDAGDSPSGRRVYLEIKTPIYADPEGKMICGLLGIATDITERKQAEERLEQRVQQRTVDLAKALTEAEQGRAKLDALLESIPEGIAIVDAGGYKLLRVSHYLGQMLGIDPETLEGKTADEYLKRWETFEADGVTAVRPEDIPLVQAIRQGRTVEGRELVVCRATDGAKIPALCSAAPIRDGNGQIMGGVAAWRNIADRRQAEEKSRESEQRIRTMVDAIPQLAWTADADGYISWYNRRTYEYTGTTPQRLEGWNWQSVIDPKVLPAVLERWKASIASGEPLEMEFPIRRADGEFRRFLTRVVPLRDAHGRVVQWFGTNTDVEELTRAEEALRQANQTLEQQVQQRTEALGAAKLSAEQARAAAEEANQAKDHFLAVLSHELRTPLAPLLPLLEGLAAQVPEESREDVEMARRNVELEARLIDDLLDVTRIARGKIELHHQQVELETILRRAAEVCAPDIDTRRLNFDLKFEGDPHWVNADPARLQQVFWNLLKNAIKFAPHGGRVGVRCVSDGDGNVIAQVTDNGMGIEPAALTRIFNAFEQVDRSVTRRFGGLGLGLAICRALVELHGGTIHAESEGKDKGATFTVKLPIHKVAEGEVRGSEPGRPAGSAAPSSTAPLRILLVEDHGDTARMMRRLLMARGHEVQVADDVATALELAREQSFDLLLSDLGLPDRSGLELIQELRRMGRSMPGIALSGYGQDEDVTRSKEAGFAEHLVKPVNTPQLQAAIRRVAPGQHPRPSAAGKR